MADCIRGPRTARRAEPRIVSARRPRVAGASCGILFLLAAMLPGCFVERSFPMRPGERERVALQCAGDPGPGGEMSPRQWLIEAHRQLRHLLPRPDRPCMLTDQMTDQDGRARNIYLYFHRNIEKMQGLTSNWWALQHTAQSVERGEAIEQAPMLWPGFEDVWIPVADGVELHGFLGLARRGGRITDADCIVVLPGLWGDNGAKRSHDVSVALLEQGFHVLSIEPRGHGQSEARHPDVYYNFGVIETQDLMKVSEWLQDKHPQVRETGLMGFCWGANAALLAAWYDGRAADDPAISENLRRILEPPSPRRHYAAGVMAFSPVLRYEHFLDRMDLPCSVWKDPSPAMFQQATRDHMARKGYPEVTGSLRRCIDYDFAYSSVFGPTFPMQDAYRCLRLLPYRGQPDGRKLECTRTPVLIVHAINDPLQTAQEVADLIAQTSNPNVAAIILPGGGHIGFQAYARRYFYNLILDFFDPHCGAAAASRPLAKP